jgi:hypothetical protein
VVQSWATDIREAAIAFYRLQTAIMNGPAKSPSSDVLLRDFSAARQLLRSEWLNYKSFLRDCRIYCEFILGIPKGGARQESLRSLQSRAQKIRKHAVAVNGKSEKLHHELLKRKTEVVSSVVLRRST